MEDEEEDTAVDNPTNQSRGQGHSNAKGLPLLMRPIICICNDLYVPALRALRQVAHVVQIRPLSPVQLSIKLKHVCDEEGIKINTRTLVELAEAMDSDVRSSINALQFHHHRQYSSGTGKAVAALQIAELNVNSFKDSVKTPFRIYESIFQKGISKANQTSAGRKHDELVQMIWISGIEYDRLMTGCFELYPQAKVFDNATMDRVNQGLEIFSHFDLMTSSRGAAGFTEGRLDGYLVHGFAQLKSLFASPLPFKMKYPKQDYESFQRQTELKAILRDYMLGMSPPVRSCFSRNALLMERIPTLLASLGQFSGIKSSNPQLMRPDDRAKMARIVEMMLEEGLSFNQTRLVDGTGYRFVLDPLIDQLIPNTSELNNAEGRQDAHIYALCRLAASEIENAKIKRLKAKHSSPTSGTLSPSAVPKRAAIIPIPKLPAKRVVRDFFGRPVPEVSVVARSTAIEATKDSKIVPAKIWYVHNDGVSNAVLRSVKVSSFLRKLQQ